MGLNGEKFIMINFIIALVMGGIMGWLASKVMNRDASMGIIANVIVGCVGSMFGGWLFGFFIDTSAGLRGDAFSITSLAVSFGGAVILLGIVNLIKRGSVR